MRLSPKEKHIIAAAHLDAESSAEQIAARAGCKAHSVRYTMDKLRKLELLKHHPFINLFSIGYFQFTIFFSLSAESHGRTEALLKHLLTAQEVSWLGRLGGDYQYGFSICGRSVADVPRFMHSVCDIFGNVFHEKTISVLVSLTHFQMKYLAKKTSEKESITLADTGVRTTLDAVDHRILTALETEKYDSHRDLAARLAMPPSTFEYRLRRLRENRVLEGFTYLCDTSRLGISMYLLLLSLKSVNDRLKTKLFEFCKQRQEVNFLIEYIGAWDYEVGVEVEDPRDIINVTSALYSAFGMDLNTIRVFQVFDYPKVSKYPFRDYHYVAATASRLMSSVGARA